MEGYCMKCKTKREIKDAESITMKNGKPATQGVCPVCGHEDLQDRKGGLITTVVRRRRWHA